LLDYYESEEDEAHVAAGDPSDGLSLETQTLITKLGLSVPRSNAANEPDIDDELKVFFCSRTHSQLSQFVNELRRVAMPPTLQPDVDCEKKQLSEHIEGFKHVTLGSRKNLCINANVVKLGNVTAINERCLELQQLGTSQESRCSYFPKKENEVLVNDFRDHTLAKVRDIEDFRDMGRRLGICPYYASRAAIKAAEVSSCTARTRITRERSESGGGPALPLGVRLRIRF